MAGKGAKAVADAAAKIAGVRKVLLAESDALDKQVSVALDVDRPGYTRPVLIDVQTARACGCAPFGLSLFGVEAGDRLIDEPGQLGRTDLVGPPRATC